jgi:hypothetical protein
LLDSCLVFPLKIGPNLMSEIWRVGRSREPNARFFSLIAAASASGSEPSMCFITGTIWGHYAEVRTKPSLTTPVPPNIAASKRGLFPSKAYAYFLPFRTRAGASIHNDPIYSATGSPASQRDRLLIERSQRFVPLGRSLAENEDESSIIAMLLDDYYQQTLHAPLPQPTGTPPPMKQRRTGTFRRRRDSR